MNNKNLLACICAAFIFLAACKESKTSMIVGKWQFESLQRSDSVQDGRADEQDYQGRSVQFEPDGNYFSFEGGGVYPDTVLKGSFKLLEEGKLLATQHRYGGDTVKVVELTPVTLKVQTAQNDIIVMKKVKP